VVSKQERSTEEGIVTERGQMQNITEKGGGGWGGGGVECWGGVGICRRGGCAGGFVTWRRGFSRCDRMAQSRLARMAKVRAQWWFSITLMSL